MHQQLVQNSQNKIHFKGIAWLPAVCAFLTTAVLGLATWGYWLQEENDSHRTQFHVLEHEADELVAHIDSRLKTYELVLRGVKGYVEGSSDITSSEFLAYAAAQQLEKSAPGLQALALVLSITRDDRTRHIAKFRSPAVPNYSVRPEGERDAYAPIVFIEPQTDVNAKVIGFDVKTVPATNAALAYSRDTGNVGLSSRLVLAQDKGHGSAAAFVMYLAIYRNGVDLSSVVGRTKGLIGWADGPFRLGDLLKGAFHGTNDGLQLRIYSGEVARPDSLLYSSGEAAAPIRSSDSERSPTASRKMEFGGQRWTLVLEPSPEYLVRTYDNTHSYIALVSCLLSLVFGWMTWYLMTGRSRAVAVAQGMTHELNAMATDLEGTLAAIPDLLFELGLDGRYHNYRASRQDLLAAPPGFFMGKTVSEVLPKAAADICMEALEEAELLGFSTGKQIELHLGGDNKWFELSVAKKKTALGEDARFVMLSHDITQRKQAEKKLRENQRALQEAQRLAGIGHISIDLATGRWTCSLALEEMLGISHTFSRDLKQLVSLVDPSQQESFLHIFRQAPAKNVPSESEFKIIRPIDSQIRWVLMSVTLNIDDGIEPDYVFATLQDITRHRAAREQLRMLEKSIAGLNDIVLITEAYPVDRLGYKIVFVNDAFERRTGYRREEVIGSTPNLLQGPKTERSELDRIRTALAGWQPVRAELINYTKDGQEFWLEIDIQPIADTTGAFTHWVAVERDITERKQSEIILRESEIRYRNMFDNNPHPMWVFDVETLQFLSVNDAAIMQYGFSREEFLNMGIGDIRLPEDIPALEKQLAQDVQLSSTGIQVWTHRCKDGRRIFVEVSAHALMFGDRAARLVLAHDVTKRRQTEAEIEHLAFYDVLTGLPNRRRILDQAERALQACKSSGQFGALILIDLDDFKTINDNWGHRSGDVLLCQVAQRLTHCVGRSDAVARLGGDEFIVLLEGLGLTAAQAIEHAKRASEKVLTSLSDPYAINERVHSTTASLGITVFGSKDASIDDILASADSAMYLAKADGRNNFRFFDAQLQIALTQQAEIEADLRLSIERQELYLTYQPQIDHQDQLIGVEALIRWTHPLRGPLSPAEFIPLAEKNGFILQLGQWVMISACRTLAGWAGDPLKAALTMSINVSARQFHHPEFVSQILDAIAQTGANPTLMKLELTESLLAQDVSGIIEKMSSLKAVGVRFSLDDFGTGYSSLGYLKHLPLDQLKIDQSFVRDVLTDPSDAAIVRTILALGESLGLSVIAEGVETTGQKEFLKTNGCMHYQGYLYSRPVILSELNNYIWEHSLLRA